MFVDPPLVLAWLIGQANVVSEHLKAEEMDGDGQMTEYCKWLRREHRRAKTILAWNDHGPNWDLLNR